MNRSLHPVRLLNVSLGVTSVLALMATGCSCEPGAATVVDAGLRDVGPLFGGIDAQGYEPTDAGPRGPEPCDVPIRRVTFPLGEEASLSVHSRLWAFESRVWVYLHNPRGVPPSPPSLHLFDLEEERALDIDVVVGEDDEALGVFEVPGGHEVVVRTGEEVPRVVHVDGDGRATGADDERLELSDGPLVRLDDGRYAQPSFREAMSVPEPVALELAAPGGTVQRIELGFETSRGHMTALHSTGDRLVGIGYEEDAVRVVRFELDPVTSEVRLDTLIEGVRPNGINGGSTAVSSSGSTITAALVYQPADEPVDALMSAELFWWTAGGDAITRQVVRAPSELYLGVLALGGEMPRQTLVLAEFAGTRTWLSAMRIRGPGELEGGSEPLAVVTSTISAATWAPSDGTTAVAVVSQRQLEVFYLCEGAR